MNLLLCVLSFETREGRKGEKMKSGWVEKSSLDSREERISSGGAR